jgi:4-hydroxythreonine-4-phosphate dehydrogenase
MEALERAVHLAQAGLVSAITLAPLNKKAMHLAGNPFDDEHQLVAHWVGVTGCGEVNVVDDLWTSRVTSHIGLREVGQRLTREGVLAAIRLMCKTLQQPGIPEPRTASRR